MNYSKGSALTACTLAFACFTLLPGVTKGEEKEDQEGEKSVLEQRIDKAVKKACEWFRKHQNKKGKGKEGAWSYREPFWESGVTSLALYTMLRAGIEKDDPMIEAGFRYIANNVSAGKRPTEMYTYNVATQMLAIEEAFGDMLRSKNPKNGTEKTLKDIFEANFEFCKLALKKGEAGYTIDQQGIDLSNTQFLVMALEAADAAGYKMPTSTWLEILGKGIELQAEDGPTVHRVNILSTKADEVDKHGYVIKDRYGWIPGKPAKARGWSYGEFFKKDEIYGSMTCAGIANLLSCSFILESNDVFKKKWLQKFQIAVRDGFAWLQKYYAVNCNPAEPRFWSMGRKYEGDTFWTYYYLFTLARITKATNIRYIGNRNWYAEGADFLLKAQKPEGCWDQVAHETHNFKSDCIPMVDTAFALWFFSSLDRGKSRDPNLTATAARKTGKVPDELQLVRNLLSLLEDVYTDQERWDVSTPLDGTADVIYGYSMHYKYKDGRETKKVKQAARYLAESIIPNRNAMERALKAVKEPDPMTENYAMHMLYERWRTSCLCRLILAEMGNGISEKDWVKSESGKSGGKIKVSSGAKKRVSTLVNHIFSHGRKQGSDKLGWNDSCGRPTMLQPDAASTAWVLRALGAAAKCGVKKPAKIWKAAGAFLLTTREKEGPEVDLLGPDGKPSGKKIEARGFGLLPDNPAELQLTMDVLSALHLVRENGKLSGKIAKEVDQAIEEGLAWLQTEFKGFQNFEQLVSAKRLGLLSARDFIGEIDWKQEGLKFIGYQNETRGYIANDCARRIAATLFFMGKRFLG
ncbi:MAG: hypothetical protein ACYTFG_00520 [Planctomycetota bacterium]|jgi:hypothetical protein